MAPQAPACYIAEFIGTFMLVLTVGCNVIEGSPVWGATSIACVLMVCIYALGDVSGANFNPAVSLALGLAGKMDPDDSANNWKQVGFYSLVQLGAGLLAAVGYTVLLGEAFTLQPAKGYGLWEIALAEIFYTFMLCFVVLNTAASKVHAGCNEFYGLAIGFVIVAGGYAVAHMGAGCLNPAVAFGIDAASATLGFGWCFIYIASELVGAFLAAKLFCICREEEGVVGAPKMDGKDRSLSAKLISEFLGTFFLMLTVGLNVLGGSPAAVWSIAASLMCMIYALGSVSGAHFNPAVTVAYVLQHWGERKDKLGDFAAYIAAQLAGGIVAGLTCCAMEHGKTFALKPSHPYGIYEAWIAEFFFTFLLAFVVLSTACLNAKGAGLSHFFGLAIGSCVTVGGLAIGGVSGGSLNPAVTAGANVAHIFMGGGSHQFVHWINYTIVELLGGAAAAGMFYATRHSSEEYVSKTQRTTI